MKTLYFSRKCRNYLRMLLASLQMTAAADLMVEHVASYLKKDPVDVKFANLYKIGQLNLKGETLMYNNYHATYESTYRA